MELEYAAEQGVPGAIWKLGRMYADGDGVTHEQGARVRVFPPPHHRAWRRQCRHAQCALRGQRLRDARAISPRRHPRHASRPTPCRARHVPLCRVLFRRSRGPISARPALSLGKGAPKDAIQAARWLRLSANKGDHRAQALLGNMLFKGEEVSRQAALGLFWLIIAKDGAGPDEGWITDMYSSALAQASDSDRALAHKYLEDWLKRRRDRSPVALRPHSAGNPRHRRPLESWTRIRGAAYSRPKCGTRPGPGRLMKKCCARARLAGIGAGIGHAHAGAAADLSVAPIYKAAPAPVADLDRLLYRNFRRRRLGRAPWCATMPPAPTRRPRFDLSGGIIGVTIGVQCPERQCRARLRGRHSITSKRGSASELPPNAASATR